MRVIQGGPYVKSSRAILNFLLSKANENLRGILSGIQSYNLTIFVHAIRSQIELNALVNKYIIDKKYHESYIMLNEDRSKIKEHEGQNIINIITLIDKLKNDVIQYREYYDNLSLLLHPNPSAIKFYLQAEGTPTSDKSGMFCPNIKYYFNKTISSTEEYDDWFKHYTWTFLAIMEHYLILIDSLKNEFFSGNEEEQSKFVTLSMFIKNHEKRIIKAINQAEKKNVDMKEFLSKEINNILSEYQDKEKQKI